MKIAIAADHEGYELKKTLAHFLRSDGHSVMDLGTNGPESVDYPDFAQALGRHLQEGKAERGVLICGSGVGICVAANKMRTVRASVCHDVLSAHQGVEHDDMNVIVFGSWIISSPLCQEILGHFLTAKFSGEERHRRRLSKVDQLENLNKRSAA